MRIEIDVKGLEELRRRVGSILTVLDGRDVENVLVGGARVILAEARRRAPRGPTGNLIRSIKAKKGRRRGRLFSIAFCAVDRKIAPHAHLVEYGTGPRYQKRPKKYVGEMPAKPFFRPAVEATKAEVALKVNRGIMQLLGRKLR